MKVFWSKRLLNSGFSKQSAKFHQELGQELGDGSTREAMWDGAMWDGPCGMVHVGLDVVGGLVRTNGLTTGPFLPLALSR